MSVANVSLNASSVRTSDLTLAGRAGSGVLTANVALVVACPSIIASDVVLITPLAGAVSTALTITIQPGASFTVVSAVGDTRAFNWCVISTV